MGKNIVGTLAVLMSLFLLGFIFFAFVIVPKWKDSFIGYGVELPGFQIILISVSDLLVNYWFISLPLTAYACFISFWWIWK